MASMNSIRTRIQASWAAPLAAALLALPAVAQATPIGISGTGDLGSFVGTFDYGFDGTFGIVTVVLDNTSVPIANGGFITSFAFNLPTPIGVSWTGAGLTDDDPGFDFELIGGPTFANGVNGAPYGRFDLGASTGNGFEGGGDPNDGISIADAPVTFTFTLSGTGLGGLDADAFLSTFSVGPGDGQGVQPFVVRFKGFSEGFGSDDEEGSDKVPIDAVPEPGSLLLLTSGAAALLARRRRTS
jgi:hypothetical protein